jgi:putative transposase
MLYARKLRRHRTLPSDRWDLGEVFVSIGGRRMCLWRAVDDEGEVLDIFRCDSQQLAADGWTARKRVVAASIGSTACPRRKVTR